MASFYPTGLTPRSLPAWSRYWSLTCNKCFSSRSSCCFPQNPCQFQLFHHCRLVYKSHWLPILLYWRILERTWGEFCTLQLATSMPYWRIHITVFFFGLLPKCYWWVVWFQCKVQQRIREGQICHRYCYWRPQQSLYFWAQEGWLFVDFRN